MCQSRIHSQRATGLTTRTVGRFPFSRHPPAAQFGGTSPPLRNHPGHATQGPRWCTPRTGQHNDSSPREGQALLSSHLTLKPKPDTPACCSRKRTATQQSPHLAGVICNGGVLHVLFNRPLKQRLFAMTHGSEGSLPKDTHTHRHTHPKHPDPTHRTA